MTPSTIREPRWCQPAVLGPGDRLPVALNEPVSRGFALELRRGKNTVPLALGEIAHTDSSGVLLAGATIPPSCPQGLWDLVLREGAQTLRVPRAVVVRVPDVEEITIACTGDWHLLAPASPGEPDPDRLAMFVDLVDHLNALAPDFVIHVGDLITRYDRDKNARPQDVIRWQIERGRELLARFEVPLFVLPGNHDLAFESCRTCWQELFGKPWRSGTDDASCVFGPCHLLLMDGFMHYDPETRQALAHSPTEQQLEWLRAQCRATTGAPWRILAVHYDYGELILPHLGELGIDAFVYGHAGRLEERWFAGGTRNVNLAPGGAYRIITATPGRLDIGPPVPLAGTGR